MCTIDTNILYLTWRKDINKQRHIIGKLQKIGNEYVFEYIKENVLKANNDGFSMLPSFQEFVKYNKDVLEFFQRRLLNPQRADYEDFLDYWGATSYKDDIFAILGLTGAKLLTDNFEFIAPHKELPAVFNTDVSWLNVKDKEMIDEIRSLNNQEMEKYLSLNRDLNNSFNKKAVQVLFKNKLLGYIKSIHCENIYDAMENGRTVKVKVANVIKNGTVKEVLLKISIS